MRAAARMAGFAVLMALWATGVRADVGDYLGKPLVSVGIQIEGRDVTEPTLVQIVETKVGTPLSMLEVRETVSRLFSLGRFEDVEVHADVAPGGVRLLYDLVPVHPVDKIEFVGAGGAPGVDTGRLRREVVDRYGASPPVGRAPDLVRVIEDDLHAQGYLHASVTPRAELQHAPDRATLIFTIDPGARTTIGEITITGEAGMSRPDLLKLLEVRSGAPYLSDALDTRIARWVADRRSHGFLEAKLKPSPQFDDGDRVVHLTLDAAEGPHVQIEFDGDMLPVRLRGELAPIEREGSTDEDLLEDSTNRIEDYLREQGYRDAAAPHTRQETGGELVITFNVRKGPLYRVAHPVEISGNETFPLANLSAGIHVHEGQPFSAARLDADVSAIADAYSRQGFAAVSVKGDEESAPHDAAALEVPMTVRIEITENVRTVVGSVRVDGNASVPETELLGVLGLEQGRPFFLTQMAIDRDALQQHYANLGFQSATVDANPGLSPDRARAGVVFTVHEGPRLFVDHHFIVGNVRTKSETIERELQFKDGQPLSAAAVAETQRRLAALGLFRRTDITEIGHSEGSRDVLISVDEAPVTSIGYGVGAEALEILTTSSEGTAQQQLQFAPRAFFDIGRRNLFGKNRSLNLSTTVALWPRNSPVFNSTQSAEGGNFGFAEYRVLGTFREPHFLGTSADAYLTGVVEQQIRSSFDFARHSFSAEMAKRVTRAISVSGNYQIQQVKLFNDFVAPADQLLVDQLFPTVLLSSFSSSIIRNTRNDALDPTRGEYLTATGQIAARAIGSEVGFVKLYLRRGALSRDPAREPDGSCRERDTGTRRGTAARRRPEGQQRGDRQRAADQRAVLRGRRHHGPWLRARSARDARHEGSERLSDGRQRAHDSQRRAALALDAQTAGRRVPRRRQRVCDSQRSQPGTVAERRGIRRPLQVAGRPAARGSRVQSASRGHRARRARAADGAAHQSRAGILMIAKGFIAHRRPRIIAAIVAALVLAGALRPVAADEIIERVSPA